MSAGPTRATAADLDEVVALLAAEQSRPERHVAYLGVEPEAIRAELAGLDQPWADTAWVLRDGGGRLIGTAHAEWDEELRRAWIHGPWVTGDDDAWARHAPALLDAVVGALPEGIDRLELSGDVANTRLASLAAGRGLEAGDVNFALEIDAATIAAWPRPDTTGLRRPTAADVPGIARLHDAEFPDTYRSAAQLVEGAATGEAAVLVADGTDGGVAGYAAGQVLPDGEGYIDFVAVDEAARRTGLGRRLVVALTAELQERSPAGRVCLVVQEPRAPARALYATLGFRRDAAIVAYRTPG